MLNKSGYNVIVIVPECYNACKLKPELYFDNDGQHYIPSLYS